MEKTFKDETMTVAECKIAKTTAPYIEIENGQRLLQMYGTLATQKANAELICTAVNSYYPMLEALKKASEVLDKVGYAYCKNHDGYATEDAVDNGWDDSIVEEMKSIIAKAENKQ